MRTTKRAALAWLIVLSAAPALLAQQPQVGAPAHEDQPATVTLLDQLIPANRVSYVVGYAGAIAAADEILKAELKQSVAELRARQEFYVSLFFEIHGPNEEQQRTVYFKPSFERASLETKVEFANWIQEQDGGSTADPVHAVRRALALAPDVLFLMFDANCDKMSLDRISKLNETAKARIYCFVFRDAQEKEPSSETVSLNELEAFCKANNGKLLASSLAKLQARTNPLAGEKTRSGQDKASADSTPLAASLWGLEVPAKRIIYVIDFSGSMTPVIDELKTELKRSVGSLKRGQTFNVIVYYDLKVESFAPTLQAANQKNKDRFLEWIDNQNQAPRGSTEPFAPVKRAPSQSPQVIFFVSDGLFEDSVVDEITKANRSVRASIYCLLFDELVLSDRSGLPAREGNEARRMEKLASQNGGQSKIVTAKDVYGR